MGLTSHTLGGAVGSWEVVGVRVGLYIGGGGLLRAAARSTLSDGLVAGTLCSCVARIRGRSTLGDGVTVVGGAGLFSWSDGRRILRSCWMAWDRAMDSGGRWDCPAEGGECVRCLDDGSFRVGDCRCGAVCGIKAPRVHHAIPSGTRHVEMQAPIMLWSRANIVRIGSVRCVGTLKDWYVRNVPLPEYHRYRVQVPRGVMS